MKSFKEFNEDISSSRLSQLAAKGKGGAAAAQMKADGTKPAQPQNKSMTPAPKFNRPAPVKKNTGSVKTVAPGTGTPSSMGGKSKPSTTPQSSSKGGAIVPTRKSEMGKWSQ